MASSDKIRSQTDSRSRSCTHRSEWRFLPGKSPERLSPYYQLPCDFGSSLISSWGSEEGSEPLYFCESHAKGFLSSAASSANAASVARQREKKKEAKPEPAAAPAATSPAPPSLANAASTPDRKPASPEQSVADRCKALDRQITELASQKEAILSESDATIDIAAAIDIPLEQAILEIIGNATMTDAQKDAAIARLEELQKFLKQAAGPRATLLEAHRMKQSLSACLTGHFAVPDELKPAYRALHDNLENAIHAALSESTMHLVND